jgi:hypothetical protein
MAIQDFLSGGFYGKVGDVVGQRWHNKRYVRSYVKGTNPNTPAQQSNRATFGKATKLAQIAFNINKGHPSWDTTAKGEFSLRVGTARNRLKAGMSDADALPLYPDGYTPPILISGVSWSYSTGSVDYSFLSTSPIMSEDRQFGIMLHIYDEGLDEWIDYTDTKTIPLGQLFTYTEPRQGVFSAPEGSSIQAATTDDETHGNQTIELQPFYFQQSAKSITQFYCTFSNPTYNSVTNTLDFPCSISGFDRDLTISFSVYCHKVSTNTDNVFSFDANFIKGSPLIFSLPVGGDYTYPAGSSILSSSQAVVLPFTTLTIRYYSKSFQYP